MHCSSTHAQILYFNSYVIKLITIICIARNLERLGGGSEPLPTSYGVWGAL